MTIKIYRENDRLIFEDEDINQLYNYPVGDIWFMESLDGIQLLNAQTLIFGNRVYDEVIDDSGNTYTGVDIVIYLSDILYGSSGSGNIPIQEFSLPLGVGGQFIIQNPQIIGQSLNMIVITYETGTNYDRYGMRKYDILTTPTSVTGYVTSSGVNTQGAANIIGIFKDVNGNLVINVNGAPWPITFTVKLVIDSTIQA